MKFITSLICVLAFATANLFAQSAYQQHPPLVPNIKFQGTDNLLPPTAGLYLQGTATIANTASFPTIVRKIILGAPALASNTTIVTSTNMKVGAYTVADTTPDGVIPRNITVTRTAVSTADTGGTVVIVGTDALDAAITETITVGGDGVTVAGVLAFKTVTTVTGAGWVIAAGNDTITVGYGTLVGLPVVLTPATGTALTTLGTTVANSNTTGSAVLSSSTVDASAGTFNGSKILSIYLER